MGNASADAVNKEIDLRFVVGSDPLEFRDTLHMLADGKIEASAIVTGTVGCRTSTPGRSVTG